MADGAKSGDPRAKCRLAKKCRVPVRARDREHDTHSTPSPSIRHPPDTSLDTLGDTPHDTQATPPIPIYERMTNSLHSPLGTSGRLLVVPAHAPKNVSKSHEFSAVQPKLRMSTPKDLFWDNAARISLLS